MRRTSQALGTAFVLTLASSALAEAAATHAAEAAPTPASSPPAAPVGPPSESAAPAAPSAEPALVPAAGSRAPAPATSGAAPARPTSETSEPREATDGDEDAGKPVLPARDTLGGHISVGALAGLVFPFGAFRGDLPQTQRLGSGLTLGGDITYGVSRTVMLGAYGQVAMPAASGDWAGSSVTTIAAGPLIRYHLVQGVRFDPWLGAGAGFRRTTNGTASYTGVEWLRVQMGGDWFATSQLGFGPILELALGTFTSATGDTIGAKSVNAHFVLGGRVVFDGPGK